MVNRAIFRSFGLILILAVGGSAIAAPPQEPPPAQPPPTQEQKDAKPANRESSEPPAKTVAGKVLVPAGTRLPLVLHNAVTTRNGKPGDPIYLETLFPIIIDGRIIIPAGSYVSGEIVEAKRPGRVKGRGELMVRLTTMILPNGYTVDFKAIPTGAGTGANDSVEEEGRIKGDTDKTSDAGVLITTTGAGAGLGGLATGSRRGAGIGAGIGAAAGLAVVLLTRGPEVDLPRGTTLDVMLDRPLYLDADKVQFTDPGRASTLAGPPNRQPVRNRSPF
jgi:type IV secretion system protein VirB10